MLECIVFWSIQMIEILILYILTKYDCTIYKIKKLIEEKFFMYSMPSLGAVNPALKKLESLSCVEFESKMSGGGMLSKTYKIEGVAWLDKNKDGMRTNDEELMKGIKATLVDTNTGMIKQTVSTNSKGEYTFTGVANGNYIIIFDYDTV